MRRNPSGLPRPQTITTRSGKKVPAVLVLSGKCTHVLNPETDKLLCSSGQGGRASFVRLEESDPNAFISCTRCNKLLAWNEERAMNIRKFEPTYGPGVRDEKGNRELHVMVKGGRAALRGASDAAVPDQTTRHYAPFATIPRSRMRTIMAQAAEWSALKEEKAYSDEKLRAVLVGKSKDKEKWLTVAYLRDALALLKLDSSIRADLTTRLKSGWVPAPALLVPLVRLSKAQQVSEYRKLVAQIQTAEVPVGFVPGPDRATQPKRLQSTPKDPLKLQVRERVKQETDYVAGGEVVTKKPGVRSRQAGLEGQKPRVLENPRAPIIRRSR